MSEAVSVSFKNYPKLLFFHFLKGYKSEVGVEEHVKINADRYIEKYLYFDLFSLEVKVIRD
jgi:hypothetical protein